MMTAHILLLCILGAALLSPVLCDGGLSCEDCCFKYYPRRLRKDFIVSYYMTDDCCPETGTILVTKKSHRICVDPSQPWVVSIMNHLDERYF